MLCQEKFKIPDLSKEFKLVEGQGREAPLALNSPVECVRIDSAHSQNLSLPLIEAKIGDKKCRILIDTGAAVNILSEEVARAIRKTRHVTKIENCHLKVIGITNDLMFIEERFRIKTKFQNKVVEVNFFINKSTMKNYDAILGVEFLKGHNVVVDCKLEKISNQDFQVNWVKQNTKQGEETEINSLEISEPVVGYNTRKQIIPPKSELIIPVNTIDFKCTSELVLIQPSSKSLASGWVVSSSVNNYNEKGEYIIKVANFSDKTIHINKSTKIVNIEPIEPVQSKESEINVIEKNFDSDYELYGGQFDLQHLNTIEREKIENLLKKHANIFANSVKQLTGCKTVKHRVYLSDDIPVRQKPYRTPHPLREELKKQINDLLDAGIISVSDSPYASPIILVKKKNNTYRLVCDYRRLNLKTQPLPFPLPLISDLLDTLEGAKYYSTLDLSSGYWQMELDTQDRHKTAFSTEFGLYHWNRLPQGLKNAAASFQRLLEIVLAGLKEWDISTYLDDLIIASKTFEDHLEKLDMVFQRLSKHNLKVNPAKCQLAKNEITYLGFQVKEGKILPETRNINSISKFPIPKNKKAVRSFLGLCNFYRKFIKDFASIALPLTNLTKGNIKFQWSNEADWAFNKLKQALISYPCLLLPDVKKDFVLHTDASGHAIGAVLGQVGKDELLHPVGYASRRLTDAETRYSVFEREALAVIWGINNYRQYLYGKKFKLYCDQKSLSYALKLKDSGRITRWALFLENYDFEIVHIPGKENIPADVLSRNVNVGITLSDTTVHPFSNDRIIALQHNDSKCQGIISEIISGKEIEINKWKFFLKNDILYCLNTKRNWRDSNVDKLVVPKTLIQEILSLAHDSPTVAHPGYTRTLWRIKRSYFWWGLHSHVLNYIKSCVKCCERRGYKANQKAPLQRIEVTERPFQRIGMDAVGPLPLTEMGNRHIIVISDYFTRWVEAYAVPNLLSETITYVLEKFICTHGIPEQLITDRGSSFLSEGIQKVYKTLNIDKHSTTSYHPSSDGVVERVNATIVNSLKQLVQNTESEWDKFLHFAVLAHRTAVHSALQDTPAHLIYGRDLTLPIDLIANPVKRSYADHKDFSEDLEIRLQRAFGIVKQNLTKAAEKQEEYRAKFAKNKGISVGDMVMLYTPVVKPGQSKKFTKTNKGVYRVKKQTSPVNFEIVHINNPKDIQLVHVDRLTKLHERIIFPSLPLENEVGNPNEMEKLQDSYDPFCPLIDNSIPIRSRQNKFRIIRNTNFRGNNRDSEQLIDTDSSQVITNNEVEDDQTITEIIDTNAPTSDNTVTIETTPTLSNANTDQITTNKYLLRPRDTRGFVTKQ